MKRIECEMCGSHDIIKADGVFVCQYCGCKYTLEEAKKMMVGIDGKVDVSGSTVKVDRTSEIANLLKNADETYTDENNKEAFNLYSQVLSIDPNNAHAIFYRAMASAKQSAAFDCNFKELNRSTERAMMIKHNAEGDSQAYFSFVFDVLVKLGPVLNNVFNTYINFYNSQVKANDLQSGQISHLQSAVQNCCSIASNIVNTVLKLSKDFSKTDDNFWDAMDFYPNACRAYRKNARMEADVNDDKLSDKILYARMAAYAVKDPKRREERNKKRQPIVDEMDALFKEYKSLPEKKAIAEMEVREAELTKSINRIEKSDKEIIKANKKELKELKRELNKMTPEINKMKKDLKEKEDSYKNKIGILKWELIQIDRGYWEKR